MSKSGPANTIISDPAPFLPPDATPKPEAPKASDWARLGRSRKYKDIDAYWEARKEYWRHFAPDGEAYTAMYIKDPEAAARFAAVSSAVIREIDDVQFRIQREMGNQMIDGIQIKYYVDDDKWYKYKGVKPPERTPHGLSEDDIDGIIRQANSHVHKWKQKGNFIFCTEGPNEHGKNVGVHRRLIGTNPDGTPQLKEI